MGKFAVDQPIDDIIRGCPCTYMITFVEEAASCTIHVGALDDDSPSTVQFLFVASLGLSLCRCPDLGSGFFFESLHSVIGLLQWRRRWRRRGSRLRRWGGRWPSKWRRGSRWQEWWLDRQMRLVVVCSMYGSLNVLYRMLRR